MAAHRLHGHARARSFFILSSLCSLCLCGESPAALDPELNKPYQLHLVLRVGESRLLTSVFRDRLERSLEDYLQASFGPLARVQVRREHPRLADVLARGLERGLDGWKERSPVKTYFVLVDYAGGYYEVRARQHDGLTGQASPVVRSDRTRDRDFVARAAALLIEQDFGLVGTFDRWPVPRSGGAQPPVPVTLRLKGGGLGVPLGRWLRAGEVFAVVQAPADEKRDTEPIPFALLRAARPPQPDGTCECELFWRYGAPAESGDVGYRCLKLPTGRFPLRLRVTQKAPDGRTAPLAGQLRVEVRRHGFRDEANTLVRGPTDANGAFDTLQAGERGLFEHVAFVSLYGGARLLARIPVALVDDDPVVVSVEADVSPEQTAFSFQLNRWRRDVGESLQIQQSLFKELQKAVGSAGERKEILEAARAGLKRTRDDYSRLMAQRKELQSAEDAPPAARAELAQRTSPANRLLESLKAGEGVLQRFIERQEQILKEETDPRRLAWLEQVEQGNLLERQAKYDEALALYETLLAEMDNDKLRAHYEDLNKRWQPKGPEHVKARRFLFDTWPTLDTRGLIARLKDAEGAVDECVRVGDPLTLERFLKATEAHAARLTKEAADLKPELQIDDEKLAADLKELGAGLRMLVEKAVAALKDMGRAAE